MISVLINTKADLEEVNLTIPFPYSRVPEMVADTYNIIVETLEYFEVIYDAIEPLKKIEVIGAYDINGNLLEWVDDGDTVKNKKDRKHTKEKYKAKLKPKKLFNENGEPIGEEPYSLEESVLIQVNKFYGFKDRNINY